MIVKIRLFSIILLFLAVQSGIIFLMIGQIMADLTSPDFLAHRFIILKEEPLKPDFYIPFFEAEKEKLIYNESDFIEINLSQMKLSIFKKGRAEREFSILAKGDPESWGGSAEGLYRVLSGYVSAYSVVSEVYMPYALNYYGKYWIHGRPIEPSGSKFISPVSGGCLQFSDKDAKEIYEAAEINMPVLVVNEEKDDFKYSLAKASLFPEISAEKYLVADLKSGFIFARKNESEPAPIASLTKLMTALVVSENVDLARTVLITEEMLEKGFGETSGVEQGERLGVVELFYPLLIES